ncbi:RHS repeat-associated core domain-containing protein [Chryseobacterium polytrichastri]|uniref:RHS repeat-associated core domain-containing protein n=1 Tax=Chryseobacterium polytrichastri TaxID=1302687 RepID=A0A1M7HNL6_9FLAO|nr:RHS repeat-associated core domain-containing protein [Chryseobacterium polytrichastri]SHM30106.1 RHS repeat-associated core domain-containing protein [Chryseobacterium polytrichastri]
MNFAKNVGEALEVTDTNNYYAFGMNHIGGMKSLLGGYQNYKYNGKELQENGMYDYGARMYMPDIGRWGVVDPLLEKYRRHSPDNYAVNNPIMFIDPDGRDIKFGDNVYSYEKNRDYSKIKNEFDRNTYEALDYLYSTGALNVTIGEGEGAKTVNIMDEMINDKKNTFTINEQTKSGEKNEYDPNTKSVKFNPKEAVRFRKDGAKSTLEEGNIGYNSPSSRLGHEVIHGYNHLFDSKYGERRRNDYSTKSEKSIFTPDGANLRFKNEEEEFTTTNLGNQMNKALTEDQRTNYGIIPYPVGSVKSIKEVKPPTTPTP